MSPLRSPASAALALAVASLAACERHPGDSAAPDDPTWYGEVRPIVHENCASCHQGGRLDINLESYEEVAALGALVADKVDGSESAPYVMPPWPTPDAGDCEPPLPWADDPRLTDTERATVRAWVEAGAPEGDEASATPTTIANPPDLVGDDIQTLPGVDYTIPGTDDPTVVDDSNCFSIPLGLDEDRWLRGLAVNPDPGTAIHHVIVATDPEGVTGFGDQVNNCTTTDVPGTQLVYTWIGNTGAFYYPPDSAALMKAGSRLLMTIHYHMDAEPRPDNSSLALSWATEPPRYQAWMDRFGGASTVQVEWEQNGYYGGWADGHFELPADTADHQEVWWETWGDTNRADGFQETELPVWGVFPHMHYAGKSIEMQLHHADGSDDCLAHIDQWDFAWQTTYLYDGTYAELPRMSPGDQMEIDCHYDNTLGNDRLRDALTANGYDATFDMTVGEGAFNEMCVMHYGLMREL